MSTVIKYVDLRKTAYVN